jgi:hypothetical protein
MEYHRSIAATCEQTVTALSAVLNAHGYRLERSFDLRSARYADQATRDQYLILLAYVQTATTPPLVITLHESCGITRVQMEEGPLSDAITTALVDVAGNLTGG